MSDGEVRILQIEIEGAMCKTMSHFHHGETDLQAALQLTQFERKDATKPDGVKVRLSRIDREEWLPPRCKRKQIRRTEVPLLEMTLGGLRAEAGSVNA